MPNVKSETKHGKSTGLKIPLIKTVLHKEEKRALADFILSTDHYSMGDYCRRFESEFAEWQGRDFATLYNSGGSANLALLQALKNMGYLKPGMRIGFSAITWATNVFPILQVGCIPVPIDIETETLNVSIYTLMNRYNECKIDVLFATNLLGYAGDLGNIADFCREKKIILLEDNCEAMGTELHTGKTGNFGLASTFSFFSAHHMSTIEGGMVATDSDHLNEHLIITRANGWDRALPEEKRLRRRYVNYINDFYGKYTFYDIGFNMRPTEITGFLGCIKLASIDENNKKREENAKKIDEVLKNATSHIKIETHHIKFLSQFAYPIVYRGAGNRFDAVKKATLAGIETRPIVSGSMQKQPAYKKYVKERYNTPNADYVHYSGLYFANNPELTDDDIELIGDVFG